MVQKNGKKDQKWLFTILHKVTKGEFMGKTIIHIKDNGSESYDAMIEYVDNYRAEGGAVTVEYDHIHNLKVRKIQCGGIA